MSYVLSEHLSKMFIRDKDIHNILAHTLNKHETCLVGLPNHFSINHRPPKQSKLTNQLHPIHVITVGQMRTLQVYLIGRTERGRRALCSVIPNNWDSDSHVFMLAEKSVWTSSTGVSGKYPAHEPSHFSRKDLLLCSLARIILNFAE